MANKHHGDEPHASSQLHDISTRPLSELGRELGYEEYAGARPGPALLIVLGPERKIILPYMSFQQAIYRNKEIMLSFSTAQIIIDAKGEFGVPDFLDAIQNMRVQSIEHNPHLCAIRVLIDPVEPKEDSL